MALDHDLAGLADVGLEPGVLAQPPHQHAGAAVDEALGQPLVQCVGELVLDRAGNGLPVLDRRASPDGWPRRSRSGYGRCGSTACRCRRRPGRPARPGGRTSRSGSRLPASGSRRAWWRARRGWPGDLPVVGNLADLPQPLDRLPRRRQSPDVVVARGVLQHQDVLGDRARVSPLSFGVSARVAAARRSRRNRARCCATAAAAAARTNDPSSACASSVSNGGQRPVAPKVPSWVARGRRGRRSAPARRD